MYIHYSGILFTYYSRTRILHIKLHYIICSTQVYCFLLVRDVELLVQADVVVAEVTQPSLGVGYEIGESGFVWKQWGWRLEGWPNTAARLAGWRRVAQQGLILYVMATSLLKSSPVCDFWGVSEFELRCCRSNRARYQLSHPSPPLATHPSAT